MELVILTKSSKFGNYCVAGIDVRTRRWVRLVTDDESVDGALTDDDCRYADNSVMRELDMVNVFDAVPCGGKTHQSENHLFDTRRGLQKTGTFSVPELKLLLPVHPYPFALGSQNEKIARRELNIDHSLELIAVSDLYLRHNEKRKLKASFVYQGLQYENFSVTDPALYGRNQYIPRAILAISLGNHPASNGYYYKFLAKCYPLNR